MNHGTSSASLTLSSVWTQSLYLVVEMANTPTHLGSYGSVPKPIAEARQRLLAQIEANPDRFMRRDWLPLLYDVRQRTAEMIGATADECMIVPNTTHGIQTIVNNIRWQEGDRIMICV